MYIIVITNKQLIVIISTTDALISLCSSMAALGTNNYRQLLGVNYMLSCTQSRVIDGTLARLMMVNHSLTNDYIWLYIYIYTVSDF